MREELVIDVTPAVINRTAMYFVVRDTVKHLYEAGFKLKLQACCVPLNTEEFISNDCHVSDHQQAQVGNALAELLAMKVPSQEEQCIHSGSRTGVALAFDPLYATCLPVGDTKIVYVLDLTPLTHPYWHRTDVSRAYQKAFQCLYDPTTQLIAISKSTARDIWANLGISGKNVHTVYLYNRPFFNPICKEETVSRTFLYVGSLEERKNPVGLIEAFNLSGLSQDGWSLRIVGGNANASSDVYRVARQVKNVEVLGRLDDEQLQHEYETCSCFVLPSFWEGLGLPALEALCAGIPLVLSSTGALPEVGGPFAIYVDPCNTADIAQGLAAAQDRIINDTQQEKKEIESRLQWVNKFSKQTYLDNIKNIIEGTMRMPQIKTSSSL